MQKVNAMGKTRFLPLGLVMILGVCSASATRGGDKKEPDKKEPVPTFTEEDQNKTFPLEKGSKARLKLKSNPTTGFEWLISRHDIKNLKLTKHAFEGPKKALPGAGGYQLFEFQGLQAGKTELELVYRRVFEKDVKPAQTFKITFEVK